MYVWLLLDAEVDIPKNKQALNIISIKNISINISINNNIPNIP